jgi:Tol biopolymer transport system component
MSVEQADADGRVGDLWLMDLSRGISSRLTFHPGSECCVTWSPDGSEIVFSSARSGPGDLYRKPVADPSRETLLLKWPEGAEATSWSPDGRALLFETISSTSQQDVWLLPINPPGKPEPLLQGPFNEEGAIFSPDGRWFAYVSDESGRSEVYVRGFPSGNRRYQVSVAGGALPKWRRDGREIYFEGPGGRVAAARIDVQGSEMRVATPVELFTLSGGGFSPGPDGSRFLVDAGTEDPSSAPLSVVLGWNSPGDRP